MQVYCNHHDSLIDEFLFIYFFYSPSVILGRVFEVFPTPSCLESCPVPRKSNCQYSPGYLLLSSLYRTTFLSSLVPQVSIQRFRRFSSFHPSRIRLPHYYFLASQMLFPISLLRIQWYTLNSPTKKIHLF